MAATSTSDPPAPTRRQKKKTKKAKKRAKHASRKATKAKASANEASGAWYPRWYWPSFTVPGIVWLALLFLLPFFTVLSVAFGTVDPIFRQPLPVYQPWWWSFDTFVTTAEKFYAGDRIYFDPLLRTLLYVAAE